MISGDDSYGRSNRQAANNQSVTNPPKSKNLAYGGGPYNPGKIPGIGSSTGMGNNNEAHDHMF